MMMPNLRKLQIVRTILNNRRYSPRSSVYRRVKTQLLGGMTEAVLKDLDRIFYQRLVEDRLKRPRKAV